MEENKMLESVVTTVNDKDIDNAVKMLQSEIPPVEQAEHDLNKLIEETTDLTGKEPEVHESTEALENAISADQLAQLRSMMFRRPPQQVRKYKKIGRNDECPCGSGKKYKNCCLASGKFEELEYKK